jgi:hypothetical protein
VAGGRTVAVLAWDLEVASRRSTAGASRNGSTTREGKVYCAVGLDAFSRRVVGWSIDAAPTAALVPNAFGMVIGRANRRRRR